MDIKSIVIIISDIHTITTKTHVATYSVTTAVTVTNIIFSPETMNAHSSGITISFTGSVNMTSNAGSALIGMTSGTVGFSRSSAVYVDFSSSGETTSITTLCKSVRSEASSTVSPTLSFSSGNLPSYSTIIIHSTSISAPSRVPLSSSEISSFNTTAVTAIASTSTIKTFSSFIASNPTGEILEHMRVMGKITH